jgi:hypothetical protein
VKEATLKVRFTGSNVKVNPPLPIARGLSRDDRDPVAIVTIVDPTKPSTSSGNCDNS